MKADLSKSAELLGLPTYEQFVEFWKGTPELSHAYENFAINKSNEVLLDDVIDLYELATLAVLKYILPDLVVKWKTTGTPFVKGEVSFQPKAPNSWALLLKDLPADQRTVKYAPVYLTMRAVSANDWYGLYASHITHLCELF